ncbi:MAG: branched-chain amino acid ABC transporter substrate-binding protein [Candidatus Eremiobacteraeota bacterium]|nr:branched-chain amino acid ABC transporter substrate-binding protein [Candidatus Eremiobacteraeota bacterium]
MSGADASIGLPTQNGAVLAVEEANKNGFAGGKFKLDTSLLDDAVQGKHDPNAGAQNVKTFIADDAVLAMVGPFNSNVAQAEIPLTNDAGLAQISPSNTNDGLTVGDNAKKLRTAHPDTNTYFRVCTRDSKQGQALAQVAAQRLGFKKAFVIDDNETYGKGLADVFDAQFRQLGGTVLGHEHITANQVDFKALLTKIKSQNPDAIFFGGNTSTGGGLIRRQMADVGMAKTPFLGGDGISDDEFEKQAGDMANGSYMTTAAPDVSKLPSAKTFVDAYKARFKGDVGPYSANAYTGAKIEIAAIEKAINDNGGKMPTRADVLKNIAATTNFDSPIGNVGFDANGDTTNPILTLFKVQGGKRVVVDTIAVKT